MSRRCLGAFVAFLAGLVPVPAAAAQAAPTLVIEGKGFGHGVGMPQDGAHAMAAGGASAAAILARFYPGTEIARRTATVRVAVHESPGPVVVVLPNGGELRDAPAGAQSPGFPVTVNPGGRVRLTFDGSKYRVTPLAGAAINRVVPPPAPATTAPPPPPPPAPAAPATTVTTNFLEPLLQTIIPTTVPPTTPPAAPAAPPATVPAAQTDAISARVLWAVPKGGSTVSLPETGRSYRGTVQAAGAGRGLQLTNEVDVEQYVRGLGEMPASWPPAALQAQAIVARTFAIRAAAAGKVLCDHQQCQVYIGAGNEHPASGAAAVATKGQVLTFRGNLAEAVYSASAGGVSATAEEGFGPGSPEIPYLQPVAYSVADPQLWAMTVPLGEVAARFGYPGELREVKVTRTGPSGRPLEITFEGDGDPMVVHGHRFWSEFDLRSTLYTLRTEVAEPLAEGAPLAASVPDFGAFDGASPAPAHEVAGAPASAGSLGRAPWVGLASLLLATWATFATRARRRPAPVVASEAGDEPGPEAAPEAEPEAAPAAEPEAVPEAEPAPGP